MDINLSLFDMKPNMHVNFEFTKFISSLSGHVFGYFVSFLNKRGPSQYVNFPNISRLLFFKTNLDGCFKIDKLYFMLVSGLLSSILSFSLTRR